MNLRFILLMAWYYGIKAIKRGPSYLIASLATPLTLLFLVFVLSHGTLVKYAIVGGLIAFVGSVGLSSAGDAAFMRLQLRVQDMYVASNIKPFDYMMAFTLSYLVFSVPGIILYIALGMHYHLFNLYNSIYMLLIMISLILTTTSISFIIAGSINHLRNIWGITGILSILTSILPPTFYPYYYVPRPFLYLLSLSPTTPAAVLVQGVFHLAPLFKNMIYIIIIETVFYTVLGRFAIRWREN
ncbi:ABC transporter permease [Picrophilus oshimae]|uniref:ABC-2 type transport system permease protein n=1 Tax=Picrophilus torridus (strain ATCC 700027 / DSM 9790 / JCM 10055 / NBRC 100828 / KAW 2/3) TaxID=1122961 RepID=Q6L137_PICTO|nr:ABC transporter permease [Picrophilus oshimae]AAT43315.1 daunorubicin resistance ATP-binding protein DrrB [Picrophilus oshimae DSM 9789]SMD30377.1 ABC-2 type transport system permease protein [Picrophilus oshimae DSM 9789]